MTLAFTAPVALHLKKHVGSKSSTAMCAVTPGDSTANRSKYAAFIDSSRLNKAPIININAFPNEDYNYVSVEMQVIRAEEYAAASFPKPAGHDPKDASRASEDKWAAHFDPKTVNTAPFIHIIDGKSDKQRGIGVSWNEVALQVNVPEAILGSTLIPVFGPVAKSYGSKSKSSSISDLAPEISISGKGDDPYGSDSVSVAMVKQPLNLYNAELILKKYRTA